MRGAFRPARARHLASAPIARRAPCSNCHRRSPSPAARRGAPPQYEGFLPADGRRSDILRPHLPRPLDRAGVSAPSTAVAAPRAWSAPPDDRVPTPFDELRAGPGRLPAPLFSFPAPTSPLPPAPAPARSERGVPPAARSLPSALHRLHAGFGRDLPPVSG